MIIYSENFRDRAITLMPYDEKLLSYIDNGYENDVRIYLDKLIEEENIYIEEIIDTDSATYKTIDTQYLSNLIELYDLWFYEFHLHTDKLEGVL